MKTVALTRENGLCCSCGICAGACPKSCIRYERSQGIFLPVIDESQCVGCGLCLKVCPGIQIDYRCDGSSISAKDATRGPVLNAYVTWSKDAGLRHRGASGGTVMTMVRELLRQGAYDGAFCVATYQYDEQVKTELVEPDTELERCSKSRYLPVSHEIAVRFIRQNPTKRLILVGTSCAISGLCKTIEQFRLNRENYLLIGLFCERLFQYNIFNYFANRPECKGRKLTELHFKNKESGGWPGNPKLMFADGSSIYLDAADRTAMKDFFQPERCMYCIDKLNVFADISCGDNYTQENDSPLGANSTIVRTQRGQDAFRLIENTLEIRDSSIEAIEKAQVTDVRGQNCLRQKAVEYQVNIGLLTDGLQPPAENGLPERLQIGADYLENPRVLSAYLQKKKIQNRFRKAARLPRRLLKRLFMW